MKLIWRLYQRLTKMKEKRRKSSDRFQLDSDIVHLSNTTRNYFLNIFHQFKDNLADVFYCLVAAGQKEQRKIIIDDEIDESNASESTILYL